MHQWVRTAHHIKWLLQLSRIQIFRFSELLNQTSRLKINVLNDAIYIGRGQVNHFETLHYNVINRLHIVFYW